MFKRAAYLYATIVKPLSRGATAFSPAYAQVPLFTPNGYPFRVMRVAPPLGPTDRVLNLAGFAPGPTFSPPVNQPLSSNPYATQ